MQKNPKPSSQSPWRSNATAEPTYSTTEDNYARSIQQSIGLELKDLNSSTERQRVQNPPPNNVARMHAEIVSQFSNLKEELAQARERLNKGIKVGSAHKIVKQIFEFIVTLSKS
jgi:hypothetical protein